MYIDIVRSGQIVYTESVFDNDLDTWLKASC